MKHFFALLKTFFQFLKCLTCSHRDNCEYSLFFTYKGIKYVLTTKPVEEEEEKKEGE